MNAMRDGGSVTCANCDEPIVYDEGTGPALNDWAWRHRDRWGRYGRQKDCFPGIEPHPGEPYPVAQPGRPPGGSDAEG